MKSFTVRAADLEETQSSADWCVSVRRAYCFSVHPLVLNHVRGRRGEEKSKKQNNKEPLESAKGN